jgi:hypothetical protein
MLCIRENEKNRFRRVLALFPEADFSFYYARVKRIK